MGLAALPENDERPCNRQCNDDPILHISAPVGWSLLLFVLRSKAASGVRSAQDFMQQIEGDKRDLGSNIAFQGTYQLS